MKKFFIFMVSVMMVLCMVGCGEKPNTSDPLTIKESEKKTEVTPITGGGDYNVENYD